jgi:hypothetical protein
MDISNNFSNIINDITTEYYNNNTKNNFFKQNQKYELAEVIVRNIDFQAFLSQNIYRDASNSNHIFLSYPNIKPILCPSTYKPVIDFLDNIIIQVINDGFNTFYAHVDIFSVTPSSISRFKNLISIFMNSSMSLPNSRVDYLHTFFIYNAPSSIKTINNMLKAVINPSFFKKIQYVPSSS